MKKGINIIKVWLGILGGMLCLSGCAGETSAGAGGEMVESLSRGEAMLLVATERNRYEQLYTDQIWNVTMPEEGNSFGDFLLQQVKQFAGDIKVVDQMAGEYGIELDSSENEQLRIVSEDYYSQLSQADLEYTGATQEDAFQLYQDYHLACKTVDQLTRASDLEISDSQAQVIEIRQIVLEDEAEASQVLSLVQEEGADFASIAQEYSTEDEISLEIGRGETDAAIETAAFSLEEGEISPIISAGGKYYLIQCVNPYDQEATRERKEEMTLLKKDEAFRKIYDEFLEAHPLVTDDQVWTGISCETDLDTTTVNFFSLYEEYFPE